MHDITDANAFHWPNRKTSKAGVASATLTAKNLILLDFVTVISLADLYVVVFG